MAENDLSQALSSLLSNPDSLRQIQSLMGMLGNSGGGRADSGAPADTEPPPGPSPAPERNDAPPPIMPDAALFGKMQQAFSLMRQDDPRIAFLSALRPNLSEARRGRVDEAIRLLRMVRLLPLLREQHFL